MIKLIVILVMLFTLLYNDNICRISYTGCTVDSLKTRFSNHKSNIKNNKHTCELSKHFINNPVIHELDKSTFKAFDISFKSHISITAVELVDMTGIPNDTYSRLKHCETRENYWKYKLRTLSQFGGLNVR